MEPACASLVMCRSDDAYGFLTEMLSMAVTPGYFLFLSGFCQKPDLAPVWRESLPFFNVATWLLTETLRFVRQSG